MLRFETSKQIEADPSTVWSTLIQTGRWPDWGAGVERVDGELAEGGRMTLHVAGQSRPFKLKVAGWEPQRHIELTSGMPLGLFTGRRTYDLDPVGGGTRFRMVETFGGPLAPLIGRTIPDLQPSFDAFAAGLAHAAEGSIDPGPGPGPGSDTDSDSGTDAGRQSA
ncbi:MAG: SRPBCC domain-containing protein [Actinomycetota bacterium]